MTEMYDELLDNPNIRQLKRGMNSIYTIRGYESNYGGRALH
jgi:hypothetical protein